MLKFSGFFQTPVWPCLVCCKWLELLQVFTKWNAVLFWFVLECSASLYFAWRSLIAELLHILDSTDRFLRVSSLVPSRSCRCIIRHLLSINRCSFCFSLAILRRFHSKWRSCRCFKSRQTSSLLHLFWLFLWDYHKSHAFFCKRKKKNPKHFLGWFEIVSQLVCFFPFPSILPSQIDNLLLFW